MTVEIKESTNKRRDDEDDIICRIKIGTFTFDGILDQKFLVIGWLT